MIPWLKKKSRADAPLLSSQRPWQIMLLGCVVLPVKLPFSVPGICSSPQPKRSNPARVVVPQRRTPARTIPSNRRPVVTVPASAVPRQPVATASLSNLEARVQAEINQIRRSYDLKPMQGNRRLAKVARGHSQNMAARSFFGHTDPSGNSAAERVQGAGIRYQLVAENLAWVENAPDPVDHIVQGWLNSPGHRANILRPEVRETGVGIFRTGNQFFFTQLFMTR
ncbi:hypothetical protein C1752_02868 [Acaryochloris thomasi RCC1774]|uniref:SCP domain-containing protein n=1 Tax=Acaryochloris thomasi RCC1774 TaxID=1764569 RepID=A0A2W1JWF3_9CYAN|nr:CAP domain-containing protein [Acaryochloris thomasi]PZD73051.1 hypothetical protein C1752_02868 [Acaryochloris thomasi RCC1774]